MSHTTKYQVVYQFSNISLDDLKRIIIEVENITGLQPFSVKDNHDTAININK